jgi:hypothetical protein
MRTRALTLAVPLLLAPGVLACFSGGYFDTARLRAGILAWALLLATVALLRPAPPRGAAAGAALAGLAGLTALTGLSLLWAPLAGPAADDLQRLLLYLPVLAAGVVILREPAAARLAEPLLLAAITGATLYGLSERLLPGIVSLERVISAGDRLAHPLTYWNGTGAFAAIGLVLAAGVAGDPERPLLLRRAASATAPALGLALYLTFSRGALGALAVGLGLLLALFPTAGQLRAAVVVAAAGALAALAVLGLGEVATAGGGGAGQGAAMLAIVLALALAAAALSAGHERRTPGSHLPRLRVIAVALLGIALLGTVVAVTRTERRGGADAPEATPGRLASVQSNRYEYWRVAVRTFGEHPVLGQGSGSFRVAWLRERSFRESVRDAHSLYFETAAELGLAGLACLVLLFGGVVAFARRARGRAGPSTSAAIAAVATWALHAGLDWDWELPALSLVAIVLAARLLAAAEPAEGRAAATGPPAA